MKHLDNFLNSITMYRLVLYGLIIYTVASFTLTLFGVLAFDLIALTLSLIVLTTVCFLTNQLLARIFNVAVNAESKSITALILFLIMQPERSVPGLALLALTAIIAISSKYLINFKGRHIFNPAAFGVVLMSTAGLVGATWWIALPQFLPFTTIVGLLVIRKIKRLELFGSFLIPALTGLMYLDLRLGLAPLGSLWQSLNIWPIMFFGTIMLTEPLTSPPGKKLRILYGFLIGLLFSLPFTILPIRFTPELALLAGNVLAFLVSPKYRLILKFKQKVQMAERIFDFVFIPNRKFSFEPGQYLEWTLRHKNPDSRGNRRYFTIASSPKENALHLGVKIPDKPSSFKRALLNIQPGEKIFAGSLSGDFILPKDKTKKIVAVAGGIGITPFRSMIKTLLETQAVLDMVLFYATENKDEFVYDEVLEQGKKVGVKIIYLITNTNNVPANWHGQTGYLTEELIKKEVPEFQNRIYYLSGPDAMVRAYEKLLKKMKISRRQIRTDYFPGY